MSVKLDMHLIHSPARKINQGTNGFTPSLYKWKWSLQLWSNLSSYKWSPEKILRLQRDWNSNPWLRDTGAMLYQLSSKTSSEAGQVRVQLIPVIWRELRIGAFFLGFICNCLSYFITARIDHFHLYSLSAVHSYYLYHIHIYHVIVSKIAPYFE